MRFLISEKLSSHKYKTPEGYLVCVDSILARTGKQTYRRCEVFGDACDNADDFVEIDRKEEEVFSDKTLASFENKPICVEHPNEDVNVENHSEYAVGFVRDIKRGISDGQQVMLGTLIITDAKTIEEIENGEHTDLSCGYDCDIVDEDNPQQRNIRGNHVALCQQGRAGIAHIVDSTNDATIPKGYKKNGKIYEIEFDAYVKNIRDLLAKFKARYRELYDIWLDGIEDYLEKHHMNKNGEVEYVDNQLAGEDGYSVYILMDAFDEKKYFGSIVIKEKEHRFVDSMKDAFTYYKGFVFSDWKGDVHGEFKGFYNPGKVESIGNAFIVYVKNANHGDLYQLDMRKEDGFTVMFDTGVVRIDFTTLRYQNAKETIAKYARSQAGTNNIVFDSVEDSTFTVGFVNQNDQAQYVDVSAADIQSAIQKVKNEYRVYRVFECRKIKDEVAVMNDAYKKYATNKLGKLFVIEEKDEKVIVTNNTGAVREFGSIKEAEATLRSKGFTIFDEFSEPFEKTTKHLKEGVKEFKAEDALRIIKLLNK